MILTDQVEEAAEKAGVVVASHFHKFTHNYECTVYHTSILFSKRKAQHMFRLILFFSKLRVSCKVEYYYLHYQDHNVSWSANDICTVFPT